MKLDLRKIIHVPGASVPFDYEMDLTHLDFYGARPITRPLQVQGTITNRAGALLLEEVSAAKASVNSLSTSISESANR